MKNAEYQGNLSCPQRASAEHEGYAGAQSVGGQDVKEQDGADLLERILSSSSTGRRRGLVPWPFFQRRRPNSCLRQR